MQYTNATKRVQTVVKSSAAEIPSVIQRMKRHWISIQNAYVPAILILSRVLIIIVDPIIINHAGLNHRAVDFFVKWAAKAIARDSYMNIRKESASNKNYQSQNAK